MPHLDGGLASGLTAKYRPRPGLSPGQCADRPEDGLFRCNCPNRDPLCARGCGGYRPPGTAYTNQGEATRNAIREEATAGGSVAVCEQARRQLLAIACVCGKNTERDMARCRDQTWLTSNRPNGGYRARRLRRMAVVDGLVEHPMDLARGGRGAQV